VEAERQHARGRQQLRLARKQRLARRIVRAIRRNGLQASDGAGAAVGEHVFLIKAGGVELDVGKIGLGCHGVRFLQFERSVTLARYCGGGKFCKASMNGRSASRMSSSKRR